MFALRLDPLLNIMCFYFAKIEVISDFNLVFL